MLQARACGPVEQGKSDVQSQDSVSMIQEENIMDSAAI